MLDNAKLEALIKASDAGEEWAQREYGRIFDEYDMDPDFIDRVCQARVNIYKGPAERGDKSAILRYAHALAHLGYEKEAYNWYLSLINKGDTDAMLALSEQYNKYGSFGHNPDEEMRWLKLAGSKGNAEAQAKLGLKCLCVNDRYNALLWYELSAKQNHPDGKIGYAECLRDQLSALSDYSKGWDEFTPGRYDYIKNTYGQPSPEECRLIMKDLFVKIEDLFLSGLDHSDRESYLSEAYFGLSSLYLYPQGVCEPLYYLAAYYNFEDYLVLGDDFAYDRCLKIIEENKLQVTERDLQEWDEIGVYEWAKKHGINIFAKKEEPETTPDVSKVTQGAKPVVSEMKQEVKPVVSEMKQEGKPVAKTKTYVKVKPKNLTKEQKIKLAMENKISVNVKTSPKKEQEAKQESPVENQQKKTSSPTTIPQTKGIAENPTLFSSATECERNKQDFDNFKKVQGMFAAGNDIAASVDHSGLVRVANKHQNLYTICWGNIVALDVGSVCVIGLCSDGTVRARHTGSVWTYNKHCEVSSWKDIIAICTEGCTTVGLRKDGTVCVAGECNSDKVYKWREIVDIAVVKDYSDWFAQASIIGLKADGTVLSSSLIGEDVIPNWKDIIAISGRTHLVGLKSDGTVVATGKNAFGRCDVSSWKDIVSISAGQFNTVGLKADGTVVIAGDKSHGQKEAEKWQNVVAIKSGWDCVLGLTADGVLKVAGKIKHNKRHGVSFSGRQLFLPLYIEEDQAFMQSVIRGRTDFLKQFNKYQRY